MYPEEGRSAIYAAARAIADLRLGRIDAETTANVGEIRGGTARNIVPERCQVSAEARSRDERKLADLVQEMVDAFTFAASLADCEVDVELEQKYRAYRFRPADEPVRLAFAALAEEGFAPRGIEAGGGADANVFNARGRPCVNLANGMGRIHSAEEHIAVADLEAMVDVTLALVEAARTAA
jgi:tripeptide aminopeptidase